MNFFPSAVIIRLVLHFLETRLSYRSSLNPNSLLCIIFGVWNQRFFFLLLWLHAFYCITASCWTFLQLKLWQCHCSHSDSICSGFIAVSCLVIWATFGESFNANSVHHPVVPFFVYFLWHVINWLSLYETGRIS